MQIKIKNKFLQLFCKHNYQLFKKPIDRMKKDGLVELVCLNVSPEDEIFPPYWGYQLTQKAQSIDSYKEIEQRSTELLKECFGL